MEKIETGDRIAYYRRKRGYSKKDLAEMCGISSSSITKYENSEALPNLETIAAMAMAFGVTINRLLCGYDEEKT